MSEKKNGFLHSITLQIVLVLFLLLLPVVFLSSYINQRFMRDSIKQVTQAKVQLLESYMSQIDWELGLAGNYVSTITFRNSTTVYLADRSSPDFYYAANRLNQDTIREGVYYQYVSGFFLFVPDTEFYYIYSIDGESSGRQNTLETFFREKLLPQKDSSDWHYTEVNGSAYLIKYSSSNGIYGGAFLALDHLHIEGTDIRFQTAGQLAQTETPRNSVLLSAASALCDLQICETMERQKVVESLPLLQQYLQIITVFMLLSVPLLFVMLRRLIVRPLHRLTDAMRRLESGDLDFRLSANTGAQEFQQIEGTFNHMSREIKGLKIAVYEEQIQTEKAKLQNLSYQLRPHFMVNCLNMAYNMVINNDRDAALQLMRFSANYMQDLLREADDFVPLQNELRRIKSYMDIQIMRYEGLLRYQETVDSFLEDISIPSMLLQNFLENSVKYSIAPDRLTEVQLIVAYCEENGIPSAIVTVRDNGHGYPNWLLEALDKRDLEALRDRIGLRNTIQRIQMLYGDQASCKFYNDSGAVTEFIFPLDDED